MLLETKVAEYVALREKLEELEKQKKALAADILELMPKDTTTAHVSGYRVRRAFLLSIKTPLEAAKNFDAVIMKEIVDKEKIKRLYLSGQNPPGVSETHYVQVSSVKEGA